MRTTTAAAPSREPAIIMNSCGAVMMSAVKSDRASAATTEPLARTYAPSQLRPSADTSSRTTRRNTRARRGAAASVAVPSNWTAKRNSTTAPNTPAASAIWERRLPMASLTPGLIGAHLGVTGRRTRPPSHRLTETTRGRVRSSLSSDTESDTLSSHQHDSATALTVTNETR
jgi:hypothetical protein